TSAGAELRPRLLVCVPRQGSHLPSSRPYRRFNRLENVARRRPARIRSGRNRVDRSVALRLPVHADDAARAAPIGGSPQRCPSPENPAVLQQEIPTPPTSVLTCRNVPPYFTLMLFDC